MRRGQDDLARQNRLNKGLCPTHGVPLQLVGANEKNQDFFVCPRGDCKFSKVPKPGTKAFETLVTKKLKAM